ncbi:unnamed protein product [Phytophthora fragariaefolia]|uniref:Unnamed protein product n=1 Tax=Phytophthora fragariaefolia TaxID=1490495 RepID=A0A9W6XG09_9STRA|nr:unnamed protein product [Phytophthora fragariaefolia]
MAYADDKCENKSLSDLRSNRLTAGPSTRWANKFSSLMDANSPSHDVPSNPDNATAPVDDAPHDSANVSHVHQGGSRSHTRLTFSPSTVRASTVCPEPRIDRGLKTFKIEPFDGSAQPGAIDSGITAWLRRFEALLGMQEDLHSAQRPDNITNALLFLHLSGAASQWYIASLHDNRSRSFESQGRALKKEFGSKLSKGQIGQMVAAERKKKPPRRIVNTLSASVQWQLLPLLMDLKTVTPTISLSVLSLQIRGLSMLIICEWSFDKTPIIHYRNWTGP